MIQAGDRIPDATLYESTEFGEFCPANPNAISVAEAVRGKKLVLFGVPGAFTPTCSAKHVPGYLQHLDAFKARGVNEIWCVSVNDGYVMAAWARDEKALGKIRFLGDGSGELTRALGLESDSTRWGMGQRMRRCSLFVDDGIVKHAHVEEPGKFEVSTAEAMLARLG